ncbi:uncharacterized protein LOC114443023 isoform X2 [Parambassis ranga]|uniref:Uncharacterized protein LOC114443023 isoform X2 n=1 Tax=Parambassis ranga TaxID=210632 RepID=A0A6P7J7H2_9TELE|nr:uncharacterized protein LOC114443023 isoform X2 [Parambassis ranga]
MLLIICSLLMFRAGDCTENQIFKTQTVRVGDDVKLTCPLSGLGTFYWLRVVSENVPEILGKTSSLNHFNNRISTEKETGVFVLYIERAEQSDAGVYFCMKTSTQDLTFINRTHLKIEGKKTACASFSIRWDIFYINNGLFFHCSGSGPALTAAPPSDPVRPEDTVTLQCSVLHDSENKTCPADNGVFCFSADSHLNYTEGGDEHENNSTTKKCFYSYFRNFSSSDARTYNCTVTTCKETVSGNKPSAEGSPCDSKDRTILCLLSAALAFSLILIAILLYSIKKLKEKSYMYCGAVALQTNTPEATRGDQENQQTDEDLLVYSTAIFSSRNTSKSGTKEARPAEEESIYTDVKTLGLD